MYHENSKLDEGNKFSYLIPQKVQQLNLINSDWETRIENENIGFIPANSDLNNLEVLLIGVNPSENNPYEKDVILKLWSDWLTAMGVEKFQILDSDLPSNQKEIIQDFIINQN